MVKNCLTNWGTSIVVDELHRPQEFTIYKDNKPAEKIFQAYEVDDFFVEIKYFTNLLESDKIKGEVMPLNASLNCAKILDTVKNSF